MNKKEWIALKQGYQQLHSNLEMAKDNYIDGIGLRAEVDFAEWMLYGYAKAIVKILGARRNKANGELFSFRKEVEP